MTDARPRNNRSPRHPIRCVHVITRLILGGAQENTLLTVEGLTRDPRYDVSLVTGPALGPEGELIRRARRSVDLVVMPELRRALLPHLDAEAFIKLVHYFRRERPTVVHTHSSKAGILARAAARLCRVPVIVHTIHGMPFHPYQSRFMNTAFIALERHAARYTDAIVSVADAMTAQALRAHVGAESQFTTIYSGMEVEPFLQADGVRERVRKEFGFHPDDIVIGKIARLFHLKGHEYVFAAMPGVVRRFPNARLFLVGDGKLRSKLERMAERLGIRDSVTFAGLVDPARIPELIKAMDLVVHASLREGLARVLPQALISGKPVISFDIDGASELVLPGRTGILVPPQSVEGLEEAMVYLISHPEEARRMGMEGRRLFTDTFRAERMVSRIDALYRTLLLRKRIPYPAV